MSPKERRDLGLDLFVAGVGVLALAVNMAYRHWGVSAAVCVLLWLQLGRAVQRRRIDRAMRELEALKSKASSGAGSSESPPPARAPE